jgi:TIR domain-containing protein
MHTVAFSMHDHSHAETHYLCDEANDAQPFVRFRDVFLGDDRLISAPRVNVVEALRHFHARKAEFGLGLGDVLVAVVQGNLYDDENDEYFFRTSNGFPELTNTCPGVGVMSLFYRLDPASEFRQPRNEAARARKAQWWDPKGETEKAVLLSNCLVLMLLDIVATLLAGLVEHDDTRGCILDYCQDPYDVLEAFKRGVDFQFCQRTCRPILEQTEEGRGLLKVAERLTARPFAMPQPSIFISYAREDFQPSERLRTDLQQMGYQSVWKDVYEIVAGVEWEPEIRSAMEKHQFIVSCFSRSALSRPRFFQQEMAVALDLHRVGRSHLIPVRFDECALPRELTKYHFIDLFPDWPSGMEGIHRSITRIWRPFGPAVVSGEPIV